MAHNGSEKSIEKKINAMNLDELGKIAITCTSVSNVDESYWNLRDRKIVQRDHLAARILKLIKIVGKYC